MSGVGREPLAILSLCTALQDPGEPASMALPPPLGQLPQELQPSEKQAKEGVLGPKPSLPAPLAGSVPTKGLPVLTELTCSFSPTNGICLISGLNFCLTPSLRQNWVTYKQIGDGWTGLWNG